MVKIGKILTMKGGFNNNLLLNDLACIGGMTK